MVMATPDIRQFLRDRGALLVHFSTLMARDPSRYFPNDLLTARTLQGVPLAFSTILRGDSNPLPNVGRGGAEGCIGLVADVGPGTEVLAVGPGDNGSIYLEATGDWISGGNPPTLEACEESIRLRNPSNEWFVRGYIPIGIFLLPPLYARKPLELEGGIVYGDAKIDLDEVINVFNGMRIFSATDAAFNEYDRLTRRWIDINYDSIIPPH